MASPLPDVVAAVDAALAQDDARRAALYPGPRRGRQPVHTVYVPADRVGPDVLADWGRAALTVLDTHGPLPGALVELADPVRAKLRDEPVEDLRIDFEDGYGLRADDDEDTAAVTAGRLVGEWTTSGSGPAFVGIRMKSLEPATRRRGLRTLSLFLDALGAPPPGLRVTLPKVTSVAQVEAFVAATDALGHGRLPFELQVETPQAVLDADGRATVAAMVHAATDHCVGLHYGTYDYSASLGIAAPYQSLEHPVADHAKAVMQVAAAGTGVPVVDGSTNVLPVGDRVAVQAAWTLHARLVRRSLERGIYQGWDLHPGQLPTRFAATFAFYRSGAGAVGSRLRAYRERAATGLLDEPATAAAMASFLTRGLDAGALEAGEVTAATGLEPAALLALAGR